VGYASTTGEGTGEIVVLRQAAMDAIKREARELTDALAVALAQLNLVTAERDDLLQRLEVVEGICRNLPRRS
jgi:hypothetical protein